MCQINSTTQRSKFLSFREGDGNEHQCLIPVAMLAGDGAEYRALLLGEGLEIEPGRAVRESGSDGFLWQYKRLCVPPERRVPAVIRG